MTCITGTWASISCKPCTARSHCCCQAGKYRPVCYFAASMTTQKRRVVQTCAPCLLALALACASTYSQSHQEPQDQPACSLHSRAHLNCTGEFAPS